MDADLVSIKDERRAAQLADTFAAGDAFFREHMHDWGRLCDRDTGRSEDNRLNAGLFCGTLYTAYGFF